MKAIKVIKVEVNEGEGTPEDPIHRVAYLLDVEGNVLAKIGGKETREFEGNDEMIIIKQ